jgi:LytS/YehU family sensor histidine kinase
MQALRAQMNPHFIFNCLNSINRFIVSSDAPKAADYLTKFAKLIRIVLQQSGKPFIPLEDELFCLQLYMDLEALRFEIPFKYEINCNEMNTSSVLIPSLLIQPFVENAIWHGLQGKNNGKGRIDINVSLQNHILHCEICDNGIGRTNSTVSKQFTEDRKKSLGIKLTRHRLELVDPLLKQEVGVAIDDIKDADGQNAGTCVHVKIPVKII